MTRRRQPGDLDVWLYKDFAPLQKARGYTDLTVNLQWVAPGYWSGAWLRESLAGGLLTSLALTPPAELDLARHQLVLFPAGELEVLASLLLDGDIDADFGFMDGARRNTVQVYGTSYMSILAGVPITPVPGTDSSSTSVATWSAALDTRSGPAETVLLAYLSAHLGPAAPVTRRRFSRLNIPASLGRGATVSYGRRFPTLLEAARVICEEGGITLDLRQSRTPGVVDVVITEQTLHADAALSLGGNTLAGVRVRRSASRAHTALVGGRGEDAARVFTRVAWPTPTGGWAYPSEVVVNSTSEETLEPMRLSGREELTDLNPPLAVSLRPTPTFAQVPGIDIRLGDLIPVSQGDAPPIPGRLEEIEISHTSSDDGTTAPQLSAQVGRPDRFWLASKINRLARALRRTTS